MNSRGRGRPRDPQIDRLILAATREHVGLVGVRRAAVSAIVERAGVGKPSLYLRWTNRNDLIQAAIADICQQPRAAVGPTLEQRLSDALTDDRAFIVTGAEAPFLRAVLFGGADDRELALAVEQQLLAPRRRRLVDILSGPGSGCRRAIATRAGEILLSAELGELATGRRSPTSTIAFRVSVVLYGVRATGVAEPPVPPHTR